MVVAFDFPDGGVPAPRYRGRIAATYEGHIIDGPKKITDSFYSLKGTPFASGIDAAFNSSRTNEAYIFRGGQYALINFAPGTTKDYIIYGPKTITESFHSLRGTSFAYGIDAAFNSSRINEAYIFEGDQYALINFAPHSTLDYIIYGPKKITDSFYSLKGTPFANGIDAAFNSSRTNEAYIFRGDQYALINFAPHSTDDYIIEGPKKITEFIPYFSGTAFAKGIDAAFNSSRANEVYIFKGEHYARIYLSPSP